MWEVRFFQMQVSGRKLSHIDPCKVWIKPFNDSRYQIWPLPRRRRGPGRRGASADDGADGDAELQDDLDLPIEDAESDDDAEGAAMTREMNHLLSEGLAAMHANFHNAARRQGDQGADEHEQGRDGPAQHSDDDSDSDSDNNTADAAVAAADDTPAKDAAEALAAASLKGKAEAMLLLPGGHGIIRYYATGNFTAECKCGHDKSMLTSTKPSQNMQAKGRPLGYLAAWLLDGRNHGPKAEHWAPENEILATVFTKRLAARVFLKTFPEAHGLLAAERPQREHEPEEPAGLA